MQLSIPRLLLAFFILGALGVFLVFNYGPGLMQDIAVQGDQMQEHPTASIVSAKCTRYYFLVSACSTEYTDDAAVNAVSTQLKKRLTLDFIVFGSVAGESVTLLQPLGRPDIVTSNASLAHIGNRVVTLLILVGFCWLLPVLGLLRILAGPRKAARHFDQGAPGAGDPVGDLIAQHLNQQQASPNTGRPVAANTGRPVATPGTGSATAGFGRRRFADALTARRDTIA